MTLKEELKLVINAHLAKEIWKEVERVKYYLTFPFATNSIDRKMAMKIKSLKGVSKFYARRRKDKTVFIFIFSKRFFD